MYILKVYGGEYEDSFTHIYYSNDIEVLKNEGYEDLAFCDEASYFDISKLELEGKEIKQQYNLEEIFEVHSDDVVDKINFIKLKDFLSEKDKITFNYEDNDGVYIAEMSRVDNDHLYIKRQQKNKEQEYEIYTENNCSGHLVESVLYEYDMHIRYGWCEDYDEE